MQDQVQITQLRIATDFRHQAVSIHMRHLNIRYHQGDRRRARISLRPQPVQRLLAILKRHARNPKLFEHGTDLFTGNAGIIHHQGMYCTRTGIALELFTQARRAAGHFSQHLLHIENLNPLVVDPGDGCQIRGILSRWQDIRHVQVHDPLDPAHQKALQATVVLGDDQILITLLRWGAEHGGQVHDRDHFAANICHTTHRCAGTRHPGDGRRTHDFQHLEDIDAKQSIIVDAKHQQRQPIVPSQAGLLINAVQESLIHVHDIGRPQ